MLANNDKKIENSFFTVCPSCYEIPSIYQSKKNPKNIEISCKCGYNRETSALNYSLKMKKIQRDSSCCKVHPLKNASSLCYNCEIWFCKECEEEHKFEYPKHPIFKLKSHNMQRCYVHKNEMASIFCSSCNEHFCDNCFLNHEFHHTHVMENILNERKFTSLDNIIQKNTKEIFHKNKEAKENHILLLKQKIEMIEKSYEENLKINNEILSFVEILKKNYLNSKKNYLSIKNLLDYISGIRSNVCMKSFRAMMGDPYPEPNKLISYYNSSFLNELIESDDVLPRIIKNEDFQLCQEDKWVGHLILLNDHRILACHADNTLKIYNQDLELEMTIEGHTKGVRHAIQLKNGNIVSCSLDETIRIWSITEKMYFPVGVLKGHEDWVRKVTEINDTQIASCSEDRTIIIWDLNAPYKIIRRLTGHTNCVSSIISMEIQGQNTLISGGGDETLRFWNLTLFKCFKIISTIEVNSKNSLIQISEDKIALGGSDSIAIINVLTFQEEGRFSFLSGPSIFCLYKFNEDRLLVGVLNGSLIEFDISNYIVKFQREGFHENCIYSIIKVGDVKYLSCSYDGKIKEWCIDSTFEFLD